MKTYKVTAIKPDHTQLCQLAYSKQDAILKKKTLYHLLKASGIKYNDIQSEVLILPDTRQNLLAVINTLISPAAVDIAAQLSKDENGQPLKDAEGNQLWGVAWRHIQ